MGEIQAPRVVTRRDLLDLRERAWRGRLESVSLAAEVLDGMTVAHRDQALEALGSLYRGEPDLHERSKLLRQWPAVHVLATSGVAADHYEKGAFWPKLTHLLEVENNQDFHRDWGKAFLANLKRLGLPTFVHGETQAGTKFVGPILLHAGMPTYCLGDFFRLLSHRRSVVPGLTPEAFVSWVSTNIEGGALLNVDVPVRRFLLSGQEFAVDVADRTFDLLDAITSGGSGDDVPLPERFKGAARRFHDRVGVAPVRVGLSAAGPTELLPRIVVDPFGQGLLLYLPVVGDAPDGQAVWVIGMDGEVQRVTTRALWPGSLEPAPETYVGVRSPIRTATVALAGREHLQLTLSVIDDRDPLMAFGDDGVLLPSGLPIPARPTWLLFPGEPGSLTATGLTEVVTESPLPPGWAGWSLQKLDLRQCTSIGVAGKQQRAIRHQALARIDVDDPLRGVRSSTGHQVVTSVPVISLPEQLGDAVWDVSLLNDAREIVARWSTTDATSGPNSIWDGLAHPIVGTYTIRVRGPWGRGATRTVTMIEGLNISYTPQWRRFVPAGLQRCTARLSFPGGDLARESIDFDERDRDGFVRVGANNEFRTLILTPPHMTVAYQSPEIAGSPSIRPLRLFAEEIVERPGILILDLGMAADPVLHVIAPTGPIQSLLPAAGSVGIYRFDLSKIIDTVTANPQLQLALNAAGDVLVGAIRPRKLFSGIALNHEGLDFADCLEVEGLVALIYATRAPWREPAIVPVRSGRASLPEWLKDAGPLRVLARIDDPWAPLPVPDWPDPFESTLLAAAGYVREDDEEATELSAFLAEVGGFPSDIADFTRLWTVRGLLGQLELGDRTQVAAETIDAAVHARPRQALLAMTDSRAPTERIASLIVRAHLASANLAEAHDDKAPIWSMRGALPAALLSAADSEWSEDEVEAATSVCGDIVREILLGRDPFASTGRLDEAAELFDRSPTMREEFVRRCGLIPQGLLSGDSRVIAAMELVKLRHDQRLKWLTKNAHIPLTETEQILKIIGDPVSQSAFDSRRHASATGSWRVVPSISLGLSLAARHASRGHQVAAEWVPRWSRPWSDLAAVVPQLVTIDLILAELLVAGSPDPQKVHT